MRLQQALKVDEKAVIMNRICRQVMKVETKMLGEKPANKATTKQKENPASSKKKDSKTSSKKGPPTQTKATLGGGATEAIIGR
jgi:hypothetical protein